MATTEQDVQLLDTSEGRRAWTWRSPLLFAQVYLPHLLELNDVVSFADFHLALCQHAETWIAKIGPRQGRHAFIAPRESGKSTWLFKILPLWVAAHHHIDFIAAFSSSGTQAEWHLAGLKRELDTNTLLRTDFPDLCAPAKRPTGTNVADSRQMYHSTSGFTFTARGLDADVLGLVDPRNRRPGLIVLDDVEPDESNYSLYQSMKRLTTITDTILPMSETAHVVLVGTVTMADSIVHQLVRTVTTTETVPEWIKAEAFKVHYFPPIIDNERSIWPSKWPLEYLRSIEHTRSFKKNFLNQPVALDGAFWTASDFIYDTVEASRTLLQIDPAVTSKTSSDLYGLAVVGNDHKTGTCVIKYARAFKITPAQLRGKVLELLSIFEEIGAVRIEVNQGGDTWKSVLHNLPVNLVVHTESIRKEVRAANLLNHYQRGRVLHERALPELEDQMCAFPNVLHDDLVDAVSAGCAYFLDRKRAKVGVKAFNYV